MKELGRRFFWIYLTLTLCFALALGILLLRYGATAFFAIQTPTRASSPGMNFVVFCASWLFIGLLICLSQFPSFARRHAAFLVVYLLIGFSYLNIVREPHRVGYDQQTYGDFIVYFLAAVDMSVDQPIEQKPGRLYLYPPFLATLLSPFVSLGIHRLVLIFQVSNYIALLLLMILPYLVLQQYRFSKELAAIALFGILVLQW